MTKAQLHRYLELGEQIRALGEELEAIKHDIKQEFPFGGLAVIEGIKYGTDPRVKVGYDFTRMARELGESIMAQYETKTHYLSTIVKLTSKVL